MAARVWSWVAALGLVALTLVGSGGAQESAATAGIVNGGFEEADEQGRPKGWVFPPVLEQSGYKLTVVAANALAGEKCVVLDATAADSSQGKFGNLMQPVDATSFRGKRVRFRAAVRTGDLAEEGRAQLWFRVDRAPAGGQNRMGAFDNMQDRPIRSDQWEHYEIIGKVDDDAVRIYVGMLVLGKGKAWLDDASLEVVPDDTPATGTAIARSIGAGDDPPQPFFTWWLLLPAVALGLFILSQTKASEARGSEAQRVALRFSCAYWLLYNLPAPINSILPGMWGYRASQVYEAGVDKVVRWTAANVLGIERTLVAPNGSGDTTFDYVRLLACFSLALGIAAVWSIVDRRKTTYAVANDLLRSYLRYVLAFIMLGYGLAKLQSTFNQFPEPEIDQLLKPYGESSPMNLVWTFMGASRPYTYFCGLGEVAGALLLVWRRTATLGALVTIGVMLNVAMLNFCYDVPVKQFSSHLLAMALYLVLPDVPRLLAVLVRNQPAAAVDLRPPYATSGWVLWTQRIIKSALLILGIGLPLVSLVVQLIASGAAAGGSAAPFGAYRVESFRRGGEEVPPLLTDSTRWRTVTIRHLPGFGEMGPRNLMLIRMMDDNRIAATVDISPDGRRITQGQVTTVPYELTAQPGADGEVVLSGTVEGQMLEVKLRAVKREDFLLVRRGFRWINEYPYNR